MRKKLRRHDLGLVAGAGLLAALVAGDVLAAVAHLIPPVPEAIHDDIATVAVAVAVLAGFIKWAVHPLREALLHGYWLRGEHEAERRAAGADAKVVRIPPRAYSSQLTPPLDPGPRHRAPSRNSRIPAPKRPR